MSYAINVSLRELKRDLCLREYEQVLKAERPSAQGEKRNQYHTEKAIPSGLNR